MSDQGAPRPRRALAPLPEDDDLIDAGTDITADNPVGFRAPRHGIDDPPPEAETRLLRRLAASPSSPASPGPAPSARSWTPSSTPVPPPQPVLPGQSSGLPASAGRRFSASTEPYEVAPQSPRRSATSVASPPMPGPSEPALSSSIAWAFPSYSARSREATPPPPPSSPAPGVASPPEVGHEPTVRERLPRAEPAEPGTATVAGGGGKRGKGRALGVIAGVVAIAGMVTGGVLWLGPQTSLPAPGVASTPQTTPEASLDPLLTAADVAGLAGSAWVATGTGATAENPLCLPAEATGMPAPDRTAQRVLTAQGNATDSITHVVDTYPDAATAARAYAARLTQSGTCADTVALIVASSQVDGLADAAAATTVDVQDDPVQHHTVLISQTGRNVSLLDLGTAEEPPALDELAEVAAKPLARLCSGGEGTCPGSTPTVEDSIPAAGQNPGWLIEADLPRINAGYGRWKATQPTTELTITGSQCETVDLVKVNDATAMQRTLLFADDPAMPMGFGVDEVTYRFTGADAAKKFQSRLNDDLSNCAKGVPTATVEDGPSAKGIGVGSKAFSGKSYTVVQKTASNSAIPYRVAILRADDRVTYLMANPTEKFDFSDAEWKAIMARAGQRVTQLP